MVSLHGRAYFKKNAITEHFYRKNLDDKFLPQKVAIYPSKFLMTFFSHPPQISKIHQCRFSFITAHFEHHCMWKQALLFGLDCIISPTEQSGYKIVCIA